MMEVIGSILAGLCLLVLVGVAIVAYIVWRSNRQMEDAVMEAAEADQQKSGGGGGPKPVK